MRKESITVFFTKAYEEREIASSDVIKYNLKPRNNEYGELIRKIQKMGHKKIITLKLDTEEIQGYANLFIYEALLEYEGELGDENFNDYVSLYCYDRYNKLSRESGANYDYYYDKRNGKYEHISTCEYNDNDQYEAKESCDSSIYSFISNYINEDYLTPKQIKYCLTVLEYGPSKGEGIKDTSGHLLYTKQQAHYYNNEIKSRLAQYLVREGQ